MPLVSSPRLNVVHAFVAVEIEHQRAILELVRLRLYAPAFALLRPQLETVVRALWVNRLATDEQIVAIGQEGNEPFPRPFRTMCDVVDQAYRTDGYFRGCADDGWAALNGYTHSGLEQLGRRYSGNDVVSNYPELAVGGLLEISASLSLSLLVPYFRHLGREDKAKRLEHLLHAEQE
jgi:hypothetical protein